MSPRRPMPFDLPEFDNIDETSYHEDPIERATGAMDYFGGEQYAKQNNPVIGRRVVLPVVAATGLLDVSDASGWRDLVQATFTGGTLWQVTLAPVEQQRANPAATVPFTGNPLVRMQFGGGGVATELLFNWPLSGASFVLPAEAVSLAVRATDATVVIAPNQPPTVSAWLMRDARPTFGSSLFSNGFRNSPSITSALFPFAKRLHVGDSGSAGGFRVRFFDFAGAILYESSGNISQGVFPVPGLAQTFEVLGAAPASVSVVQELAFT